MRNYLQHGRRHGPAGSDPLVPAAIVYDFDNVGDWLDIVTNDVNPATGDGLHLFDNSGGNTNFTSAGPFLIGGVGAGDVQLVNDGTSGDLLIENNGAEDSSLRITAATDGILALTALGGRSGGAVYIKNTGDGLTETSGDGIRIENDGSSPIRIVNAAGYNVIIEDTGGGGVLLPGLPSSDPGVSGQLWVSGGAVQVSP